MNSRCSLSDLFSVSSLALLSCSCEFSFLRNSTSCSKFSKAFFLRPRTLQALYLFCIFLG